MSTAIRRAIYGKLAGDTTLNNLLGTPATGYAKSIYHNQAPEKAGFPLVTMQKMAGAPLQAFGDPSAMDQELWQIKCIDQDDTADQAEAAKDRIVTLLNDANLTLGGGVNLLYLRRESDVEYPEVTDGVFYVHVGSMFRVFTD